MENTVSQSNPNKLMRGVSKGLEDWNDLVNEVIDKNKWSEILRIQNGSGFQLFIGIAP